jgi:hypothetical protein
LLVVIHHTSAIGAQPSNDADVVFATWLVVHAMGDFRTGNIRCANQTGTDAFPRGARQDPARSPVNEQPELP